MAGYRLEEMRRGLLHTPPRVHAVYTARLLSTGGDEAWMGLYASCGMKLQHHASGFGSGNLGPRLYSFEIRQ